MDEGAPPTGTAGQWAPRRMDAERDTTNARPTVNRSNQAAANQYPALKGLLMRSASGETSTNLSVGIFSALGSASMAIAAGTVVPNEASFARSAWLVCAERATEKNRST
jgi:hypothetical protein